MTSLSLIEQDFGVVQDTIEALEEFNYFSWKNIVIFCVIANAAIGVLLVEQALRDSKRFIDLPEDLASKFPAFRRADSK